MEFSIKSIFLFLSKRFHRKHALTDDEFVALSPNILTEYGVNIPRMYLLGKFWAGFYTVAKYGLEKMMIPPDKLFTEREAKLAYDHASECHGAAYAIRYWVLTSRDRPTQAPTS